jgi:hypothetical protein
MTLGLQVYKDLGKNGWGFDKFIQVKNDNIK